MSLFLAFLGVSFVVIATPGPDTAITIRNTLLGGRMGGVFTALGISSGQTIWALATSVGIVALLVASEPLFLAVKYAGAAYLVYLGIKALQEALRPSHQAEALAVARPSRRLTAASAFRQGLISDLGNPKMAVFFASLLPQFVPPGGESFAALLGLGAVFAVMTFTWLALYATVVAKAGDFLRRLDEIGAHIEKDNPEAAARVIARIVTAAHHLAEQPAMGRIGRIKATRELVLVDIPYIVPYRVNGDTVEIVTVMHAAQRWPQAL